MIVYTRPYKKTEKQCNILRQDNLLKMSIHELKKKSVSKGII